MFGARRFVKAVKKKAKEFAIKAMFVSGIVFVAIVSPAAAQDNYTINWTALADLISGVGELMPGIGGLVIAIVPIILLLIVVGFLVGLFDSIIGAIQDAFRFLRR
jgi:hypothetical protein